MGPPSLSKYINNATVDRWCTDRAWFTRTHTQWMATTLDIASPADDIIHVVKVKNRDEAELVIHRRTGPSTEPSGPQERSSEGPLTKSASVESKTCRYQHVILSRSWWLPLHDDSYLLASCTSCMVRLPTPAGAVPRPGGQSGILAEDTNNKKKKIHISVFQFTVMFGVLCLHYRIMVWNWVAKTSLTWLYDAMAQDNVKHLYCPVTASGSQNTQVFQCRYLRRLTWHM